MSRGHSIGLDRHRAMLRDATSLALYERAIREMVRPGDVVLALGTGTGVLAMWAAQAGARRVFAVDPTPVVRLAHLLAAHNGLDDRIAFIEADSRAIDLPEPVDVVVSECMGSFFVTDEQVPVLRDARRLCHPEARVVPHRVRLLLAPACVSLDEDLSLWAQPLIGLDLSPARSFALNATYAREVAPGDLQGLAEELAAFDAFETPDDIRGSITFPFVERTVVDGFVGWFDALLTPTVTLSTAPGQRTHQGQLVFPVEPLTVPAGARIEAHWELRTVEHDAVRWHWSGTLYDASGAVLSTWAHDTDQRYPAV